LREAEESGHDLLLDIDVQGASQIMRKIPNAVGIFILPPDWESLERRLRSRGQDAEAVIRRRLDTARREIENYSKYDYILVNDQLEQSVDQLQKIVLAERLRQSGTEPSEEDRQLVEAAEAFRLDRTRERVQPILASFNPRV
jgi:guanylate kinase